MIEEYSRMDDGFSLVELVVAIGIMGFMSLALIPMANMMTTRVEIAREQAVQDAASETLKTAWEWFYDKDPKTDPLFAAEVYNNAAADTTRVEVEVYDLRCVKVVAVDDFDHESTKEICSPFEVIDEPLVEPFI